MGERRRNAATGRFDEKYPPDAVFEAIWELGGQAATSEVAEEVGGSRNTIYKKLQAMEADGQLESRMAGGIRVWSFADGLWE